MLDLSKLSRWDGVIGDGPESLYVFPDGSVYGGGEPHSRQFRVFGDADKAQRVALDAGGIRVHAFPGAVAIVTLARPTEAQWRELRRIVRDAGRDARSEPHVAWTFLRSLKTGFIGGWSDKIDGTGLEKLREATTVRNNPIDHAAVPLRFCERCKNPVKSCAECGAIPSRGRCDWCGSTKTSIGRPSRWVPIPGTENEERICDLCWKAQRIHGRPGPSPARGIVRVNPWDDSPRGWIDPAGKFYVVEPRSTHAAVIAYEHADAPQLDEEDEKGRPKVESMLAAEAFGLSLGWVMISGFGDEGVYNFVAEPTAAQRAAIAKAMRGRSVIWVRSALQKSRLAPHTQVAHGTGLHWSAAGKRTRKNPRPGDRHPDPEFSDTRKQRFYFEYYSPEERAAILEEYMDDLRSLARRPRPFSALWAGEPVTVLSLPEEETVYRDHPAAPKSESGRLGFYLMRHERGPRVGQTFLGQARSLQDLDGTPFVRPVPPRRPMKSLSRMLEEKSARKNPADPWDQIPTMSANDLLAMGEGWTQEGWITQDGLFHSGASHYSIAGHVYRDQRANGASIADVYQLAFNDGVIRAIAETAYGQFSVDFRVTPKPPSKQQIAFLRRMERGMRAPILWECKLEGGSGVASLEKFLLGVRSNPPEGSAKWVIARPTHPSKARADGGGKTTTAFVPMPQWGEFPSRAAAVRWFMEAEDPDLIGKTDEFIGTHFAKRVRLGYVRVVRVGSNPPAIDWSPLAPAIGPGDVDPSGFGLWVTPYGRIYDAGVLGGESHPTSAMAVSKLDDPYRAIMAVLATGAMRVSSHEDAMAVSFTKWPTPYQVAILRRLVRECGIMTFHWDRHDERTTKVAESGASMKGLER